MKKIAIEERVYTLTPFNPMEGMEFGTAVLGIVAPALGGIIESVKEAGDPDKVGAALAASLKDKEIPNLMKRAIGQCFTPQNENLADAATFNKWFIEYPGDMFHLGVKAIWELTKDFFPKPLVTAASGSIAKLAKAPGME